MMTAFHGLHVAVASMIASSAGAEGYELRLTASLHEAMADVCISCLRTIGTLSTQASHHAGRTHVNVLDVLTALTNLHWSASDSLLLAFAALHILDTPMLGILPAKDRDSICCLKCVSQDQNQVQVPEFLPAFPKSHTFKSTPTCVARQFENASIRKHVTRLRRAADANRLVHRSSRTPSFPTQLIRISVNGTAPFSSVFSVAEYTSVAAMVALPYKELCYRELMAVQDESSMSSNKHRAILQQQHAHGLDDATHEGTGDDKESARA